jgi:hypothetical protein
MKSAAYDSFDIVQMLFAPPRRFIVGFLRAVVGPFAEESSLGGGALGRRAFFIRRAPAPDPRRRRQDVLAEDAVLQPPRVRPRLVPLVTRHDVRPVPLPRLAPRHLRDGRELELLLGNLELLRAALDVLLAQLAALLVLDRAEHPQRPILPARAEQTVAVLAVEGHLRRRGAVPGAEPKETPAPVGVVEDPLLHRVVRARAHERLTPREKIQAQAGAVVRADEHRPQAALLQAPHRDGPAVPRDRE